ncbi:MAG: Sec-independent protein translocase protein TatB [Pseudohongiellaceae bacterium]|jgi:sec-independent protein translocase protein TatB
MFDIGFLEIVVVGIVALVVLGPEKLPGTIRTVSLWIGRLRRSFNSIKGEIEKEIGADEIRRQLRNEEIMEKFRQTQSTVQNSISSIKKEADSIRKNVELEADIAAMSSKGAATGTAAVTAPVASTDGSAAEPATMNAPAPAETAPAAEPTKP